jgi:hypothetical protein
MKLNRALRTPLIAAAACAATVSMPVSALEITSTSSDYIFDFLYAAEPGVDLEGTVQIDTTAFNTTTNTITLQVTLINTTDAATLGLNNWTSWGFGIDPNATSVSFSDGSDGGMVGATLGDLPGFKTVELCAFASSDCNPAGGSTAGIAEGGGSDTFFLTINFADLTTAGAVIDPIVARFTSAGLNSEGSYTFSTPPGPTPPPITDVPLPGTIALLGLGLVGAGLLRTRRSA